MFFKLLSADRMRLFRRPLWRNSIIILCLVPTLTGLFAFLISEGYIGNGGSVGPITWPRALDSLFSPVLISTVFVAVLLMYVIPPLSIAKSYRERTMQNWIMRGIHRPQLILAKLINLFIAALLIILIALLMNGVVTLIITLIKGESLNAADVDWGYVARDVVTTWYALLPYITFSCLIAIWSRSAVAAMAGTLLFVFAFNFVLSIIGGFFDGMSEITKFLPSSLSDSLTDWAMGDNVPDLPPELAEAGLFEANLLAPGWAAVGLALYTLLFLSFTILAFRRQDLGG